MEHKSNRKRMVSKRVSACLVAVLSIMGLIGLYAFMPYSTENTTIKTDGVTGIAANWKTYSNSYLSFKYPDTYKITDEEQSEDSYELCCEIKGDDISMVQISVTEMGDDMGDLDESLKQMVLTVGVSAMKEELAFFFLILKFTFLRCRHSPPPYLVLASPAFL